MNQSNKSGIKLYPQAKKEVQRKPYRMPAKPYTRNLKVYYTYQSGNSCKPLISLSGKWLRDAGFSIGDPICVTIKDQQLIIEPTK